VDLPIRTKRIHSFYFDYHADTHIKKIESLFKNKILRYLLRRLIETTLSLSKLLIVCQAMLALTLSRVDVVQGNNGIHYLPYWIARLKGARLFFYFRDLRNFKNQPQEFIESASQYVFVGKNLMEQYLTQLNLPKSKCTVIHSPFNVYERIKREPSYPQNPIKKAKESGKDVIICASRISPDKGQEVVLKAYEIIIKKYPNTLLFFVGEADDNTICQEYLDKLYRFVNERNLSKNVRFLGFHKDVLQLTTYADIAVQAPVYFEALSGSLVESVQLGIPSISSNIGGANEVIADRIGGYLFPPGNFEKLASIMEEILDNKESALALAKRGKEATLYQWSPEKMKEKLCNVYEGLSPEDRRTFVEPYENTTNE
jgi:glycosyltransferase involved in cell wall biosynthesis